MEDAQVWSCLSDPNARALALCRRRASMSVRGCVVTALPAAGANIPAPIGRRG